MTKRISEEATGYFTGTHEAVLESSGSGCTQRGPSSRLLEQVSGIVNQELMQLSSSPDATFQPAHYEMV